MKKLIYIILPFIFTMGLFAQEIVVSEYYNASSFTDEWTELLVTEDNTDIVGYKLRDNSEDYESGSSWQGGVEFRNVGLWKQLRKGTVIVINHRGTGAIDTDPSDGYIEIDAENNQYFRKFNWNPISSLSIQSNGDVIQVLDEFNSNVHALAHVKFSNNGDFYNTSGKKIARVGDCEIGYSVSVGNANDIDDYNLNKGGNQGYDTGNSITTHTINPTKGLPNNNDNGGNINYQFWQSIREPEFTNGVDLQLNKIDEKLHFSWNRVENYDLQNDYGGYILLRGPDNSDDICYPTDGTNYIEGGNICNSHTVRKIIKGSEVDEFIDDELICGEPIRYTLFAYRYNSGDKSYWSVNEGRGRAYTKVFDTTLVFYEEPPDFEIESTKGTQFCSIDTTVLYPNTPEDIRDEFSYAWYFKRKGSNSESVVVDFKEPGISDSLKVYRSGIYRLEIKSKEGCIKERTIEIEVIEQPEAFIANEARYEFRKDTTIYFCGDLNYTFTTDIPYKDIDKKTFIYPNKDGENLNPRAAGSNYTATEAGTYCFIFEIGECVDTSYKVTFEEKPFEVASDKKKLDFYLTGGVDEVSKTFNLVNSSEKEYTFVTSDFDVPFAYFIDSDFPIKVAPNSEEEVEVRFAPPAAGEYRDTLLISGVCDSYIPVLLNGKKVRGNAILVADPEEIDFGYVLPCGTGQNDNDTTITISNEGTDTLKLYKESSGPTFSFSPTTEDLILAPGEKKEFTVSIYENNPKDYDYTLTIPWESLNNSSNFDTLKIELAAIVDKIKFSVEPEVIDFGVLSGCESFATDTVIINNHGNFDITINEFSNDITTKEIPFTVKAGEIETVILRWEPKNPGNYDENIDFISKPICPGSERPLLWLKGKKLDGGFTFEMPDTVDFGKFYTCETGNLSKEFNLKILKEIEEEVRINTWDKSGKDFNLSYFDLSKPLEEDNILEITYEGSEAGVHTGKLDLSFTPCEIDTTIYFKIEIVEQEVAVSESTPFNTITQGESTTEILTITNNSDDKITISNIVENNEFTIISPNINYPIELEPDSVFTFEVEFSSNIAGEYEDSLIAEVISPCSENYYMAVEGIVEPGDLPPGNFALEFPIDHSVMPGSIIEVPVLINNFDYNYNEVDIEQLSISLDYPYEAVELISIENSDEGISNLSQNVLSNSIELEYTPKNGEDSWQLDDSRIALMKFYVLDATPGDYVFNFNSASVTSMPEMSIETEDTSIVEVLENCVNTKSYFFGNPPEINVEENVSNINVEVYQPTDDEFRLSLYSVEGKELQKLLDGSQPNGTYNFNISKSDLENGAYFLQFFYPGDVISKKILIIK